MRIFITGICGFVGASLALALHKRMPDATVWGLDNLIRPGSETNLEPLQVAGVRVLRGDVRCASDFETLADADWVIDAAANPSVMAGVDGRTSSRQLIEHNLQGTLNILEYARRCGAGLLLLSTSRVFSIAALAGLPRVVDDEAFVLDPAARLPSGCTSAGIAEEFSTASPVSLYGATKLASEALALEYGQMFGFPVVVNRCSVLAGAGQFGTAEQGIISYWVRAYASRRPLRYIGFGGTGHQVRDGLHISDLAELIGRQLTDHGRNRSEIWNVGGGEANATSLARLSRWCATEFGPHPITPTIEPRPFDVPLVVMDTRRVSAAFDWKPRVTLPEILSEISAHHRQHPDWFRLTEPR